MQPKVTAVGCKALSSVKTQASGDDRLSASTVCAGRVRHLGLLEEEAVQAEDFEAAAGHSADLDAAKQELQKLQHDLRLAEGQLAAMVS